MKTKPKFISVKNTTIPYVEFVKRYSTEHKARAYLSRVRWPKGTVCPFCGHSHSYSQSRDGVKGYYRCAKCRKVFTVRTGTIFERSHVPLTKWLYACYKVITARKGQLAVDIGVTQKTAWFMLQRIRQSTAQTIDAAGMLKGIIEADAAYFGGREKSKHASKKLRLGRGAVGKVAVLGVKERGGRVGAKVIPDTGKETVHKTLSGMVEKSATLMTDEAQVLRGRPVLEPQNRQARPEGVRQRHGLDKRD